jgi:hypothetical protein
MEQIKEKKKMGAPKREQTGVNMWIPAKLVESVRAMVRGYQQEKQAQQ